MNNRITPNTVMLTVRVSHDEAKALDRAAKARNSTRTAVLRQAVQNFVKKTPAAPKPTPTTDGGLFG